MNELVAAKVRQAVGLLQEFDLPFWIVQFARESHFHQQPVTELAVGTSVTWPGVFVITASGETCAIVGTGDVDNVTQVGAYDRVIGYVKDVGPPLLELLEAFDPAHIGVSYALDDESADNITHGMFLLLQHIVQGTRFSHRIESAERVLIPLRARKVAEEVRRIRQAIALTVELFSEIEDALRPGVSEVEIQQMVHRSIASANLSCAWDTGYDPTVSFGPASSFGHAPPGDIRLEAGMLVHVDLGVKHLGYCSDLQRTWYVPARNQVGPPPDVHRAFSTLQASLEAGFRALRPGVAGFEVDAAARSVLVEAGYDEPEFALGHQLGQSAHDAGALLGPRWPRYGTRPSMEIEAGNVFTLEFALRTSAGTVGLEEDVLVTEMGAEYLSPPQTELLLVEW